MRRLRVLADGRDDIHLDATLDGDVHELVQIASRIPDVGCGVRGHLFVKFRLVVQAREDGDEHGRVEAKAVQLDGQNTRVLPDHIEEVTTVEQAVGGIRGGHLNGTIA
jgi:hypothetical protein